MRFREARSGEITMKTLPENVYHGVVSFVLASAFGMCALVALSCGSMPSDAIRSARSTAAAADSPTVEQQATGAGHIRARAEGFHRTFSFGAVRHADGGGSGE